MPIAAYKDLCLDVADARVMGAFWGGVLGLRLEVREDGMALLRGDAATDTVWLNVVPEPKTVKHRVHLDVNASSLEQVVELGATVVDADSFAWTSMTDPEGGEFDVFVREGEIAHRFYELSIDAGPTPDDAHRIATWWATVLGGRVQREPDEGFSWVDQIAGAPYDALVFAAVPEPKTVKNRLHPDVTTRAVEDLEAAGARVLRAQDDEIGWTVMADPEGNEFCAFTARSD